MTQNVEKIAKWFFEGFITEQEVENFGFVVIRSTGMIWLETKY